MDVTGYRSTRSYEEELEIDLRVTQADYLVLFGQKVANDSSTLVYFDDETPWTAVMVRHGGGAILYSIAPGVMGGVRPEQLAVLNKFAVLAAKGRHYGVDNVVTIGRQRVIPPSSISDCGPPFQVTPPFKLKGEGA